MDLLIAQYIQWQATLRSKVAPLLDQRRLYMNNVNIQFAERMNLFEVVQVSDYMEKHKQGVYYTMRPGNRCIWVSYRDQNLYFFFKDGKISDIQAD